MLCYAYHVMIHLCKRLTVFYDHMILMLTTWFLKWGGFKFWPLLYVYMIVFSLVDWVEIDDDNIAQVGLFHQKGWYDRVRESCCSKTYKFTQSEVFDFWLNYLLSQLISMVSSWSKPVLSNSDATAAMADIHDGFWARCKCKYRPILRVFLP